MNVRVVIPQAARGNRNIRGNRTKQKEAQPVEHSCDSGDYVVGGYLPAAFHVSGSQG